jgi:creatinine amidohydrolase
MSKFLAAEMNGKAYEESHFDKAIVAIGSTENHGFHLPFGTDTLVSYGICQEVASRIDDMLVLPPLYYGMSEHYQHKPFSISLKSEHLILVLRDILESTYRWGIKKIVIINGHDGNIAPIEIASREFKATCPDVRIVSLDAWWVTAGMLLPKGTFDVWDGLGHAGEGETSICLAMFPELVDMGAAKGVVPNLPPNMEIKWLFSELTSTGATGDPTAATKEKGEMMKAVLIDAVVEFILRLEAIDWRYENLKG